MEDKRITITVSSDDTTDGTKINLFLDRCKGAFDINEDGIIMFTAPNLRNGSVRIKEREEDLLMQVEGLKINRNGIQKEFKQRLF